VRGEYRLGISTQTIDDGSPPRAWGIPAIPALPFLLSRFTPTCVGNTGTRGRIAGIWRFTPTCVGNTFPDDAPILPASVHPHVRGEYSQRLHFLAIRIGSPPRAWGILVGVVVVISSDRFTPTCVGNTLWLLCEPSPAPVHPHVRGEYRAHAQLHNPQVGSPPRAWGIRLGRGQSAAQWRFTPTCVGNTATSLELVSICSVHPHVRGEYSFLIEVVLWFFGSPPRAWGIPCGDCSSCCPLRFTPTCVGNTCASGSGTRSRSVHPHVRGEYRFSFKCWSYCIGSPPRAWGIPGGRAGCRGGGRFTPTCVGNTKEVYIKAGLIRFTPTCVGNTLIGDNPLPILRFTPTCVGNTFSDTVEGRPWAVHPHVRGEYSLNLAKRKK